MGFADFIFYANLTMMSPVSQSRFPLSVFLHIGAKVATRLAEHGVHTNAMLKPSVPVVPFIRKTLTHSAD